VLQVLPRHKSFAPWHYFVKVGLILGLSVGLEFYIHSTASYKWYLTATLGFLFALIGQNLQFLIFLAPRFDFGCRHFAETLELEVNIVTVDMISVGMLRVYEMT
jgi:hypothetical protein